MLFWGFIYTFTKNKQSMEMLKTQLKNNAEVIIKLLEQDVDNAFDFGEEKVKTKLLEDIRYLLEIST